MSSGEYVYNPFRARYSVAFRTDLVFNDVMRLFKEPLIHFILIGAAFFGIYSLMNRPERYEDIVINSEKIGVLEAGFSKDWNRSPSAEELQELINDYIREELAVREGRMLGLDQNDPVVRQRIRQKLELLIEEDAVVDEPSEEELAVYLKNNSDLFRNRDGSIPSLNEIRSLVIFEWENTQRINQLDQFYTGLESKFDIQVEGVDQ